MYFGSRHGKDKYTSQYSRIESRLHSMETCYGTDSEMYIYDKSHNTWDHVARNLNKTTMLKNDDNVIHVLTCMSSVKQLYIPLPL